MLCFFFFEMSIILLPITGVYLLGILLKLTPDTINKSLKILKIFLEKSFELQLYNENDILVAALMLSSSKINDTTKKERCKQSIIYLNGV